MRLSFAFAALVFAAPNAIAGTVAGRVTDSTHAALPGVTIEAQDATTVSGVDGTFRFTVPPGSYDVSFRLMNFATVVRHVTVADTSPTRADVTMLLAANAEVVVTGKQTFRNLADIDEPVNDLIGVADSASVGVVTAKQIEQRPIQRAGEVLETVPGVVISQHSGEGKANQYYLRGFNLDHGTDVAITVAGVPVNMPTHAHGQGYADANFLIPELVSGVQYEKGPYYADEGDFASAGAVNINYVSLLENPIAIVSAGTSGFGRALVAASPGIAGGFLLLALEGGENRGPWVHPDDFRKGNALVRYTRGDQRGGFSITAAAYRARWNSTDQIPRRALADGEISRFGFVDPTDGGATSRYVLSANWERTSDDAITQIGTYAIRYKLDLFSDFTYFLDDPLNGDQFEQADDRDVVGGRATHRWMSGKNENVAGFQFRSDDIRNLGLFHTRARVRLDTRSDDRVRESSAAVFAQTTRQWNPWLRTVVGARADEYRFALHTMGQRRDVTIVNPKLSVILGPWASTEFYANAGGGFHSNDARSVFADGATPLVRTRGSEAGMRTIVAGRLHATATLWRLDMNSELVFAGDAGTTEPSFASRRRGVELATFYNIGKAVALDADYAYSHARFTNGDRIPGAVEGVSSIGLTGTDVHGFSGEVRFRYFGPRPLIEDDSVRSRASRVVNARIGRTFVHRMRLDLDAFNLLNARASDVDYFYASRLPGEPVSGIDDVHFHPIEKRAFRISVGTTW